MCSRISSVPYRYRILPNLYMCTKFEASVVLFYIPHALKITISLMPAVEASRVLPGEDPQENKLFHAFFSEILANNWGLQGLVSPPPGELRIRHRGVIKSTLFLNSFISLHCIFSNNTVSSRSTDYKRNLKTDILLRIRSLWLSVRYYLYI